MSNTAGCDETLFSVQEYVYSNKGISDMRVRPELTQSDVITLKQLM